MKPWLADIKYCQRRSSTKTYAPSRHKWRNARRKHWLTYYKAKHGCNVCGIKDGRVLTFDHRVLEDKEFSIGHGKRYAEVSIKQLINEVRKCDVLCHNCHTIKTEENKDHTHVVHCEQQKYLDFINYKLWKLGK